MSETQEVQSGIPASLPPPSKAKNGFGLTALILGIVSMVLAFVPLVNFAVGLIGLAGIIFGIVALTRKDRPKKQGLVGLILSVIASVVAIAMGIFYSFALLGAIGDSFDESTTGEWEIITEDEGFSFDGAVVEEEIVPQDPNAGIELTEGEGTAEAPAPFGARMKVKSLAEFDYELSLSAPEFGANAFVAEARAKNPAPGAGKQYVTVDVTLTYIGTEAKSSPSGFDVEYVNPEGVRTKNSDVWRTLGDLNERFRLVEFAPGDTNTETYVMLAEAAPGQPPLDQGMWVVTQSFDNREVFFTAK